MSRQQILEGIRTVLREKLDVKQAVGPETDLLADLELDSLKQLTMIVELENHFRVCFEPGDERDVSTVADVVGVVERSFRRSYAPA